MTSAEQYQGTQQSPGDPARTKLIEAARAKWVDRLIDTSRRNNLLFYRPLIGGSIDIPESSPFLSKLLGGETVRAIQALSDPQDRPARLLSIERRAREYREEKGLTTLYLGVGFVSWKADDGGRDYKAPVYLVPIELKSKGSDYTTVEARVAGDVQVNTILLHQLRQRFGIVVAPETLLGGFSTHEPAGDVTEENIEAHPLTPFRYGLEHLRTLAPDVPEFRADLSGVISNFSFVKMAMVKDIGEAGEALLSNDLIAAIAGDEVARGGLLREQKAIDPTTLDFTPPSAEFCVVDADSSQQCAIHGILAGQSAVVHGPPGTGKSQTITNLIASLIANRKTVLFVAEKRAALEVVASRLETSQLGHIAIDLHGAELSSKKVMQKVANTLTLVRESRLPDCAAVHTRLQERRAKLNAHDHRMHSICERTGISLFDMQGRLLRLPTSAQSTLRWRGVELDALSPDKHNSIRDTLREFGELATLVLKTDPSPWVEAQVSDASEAQRAIDSIQLLLHELLPQFLADLEQTVRSFGFSTPTNLAEARELLTFCEVIAKRLETWEDRVYSTDTQVALAQLRRGLHPFAAMWLGFVSTPYKETLRHTIELRRGASAPIKLLVAEMIAISDEATRWRASTYGASLPAVVPVLSRLHSTAQQVTFHLRFLSGVCSIQLEALPLTAITERLELLSSDTTTPFRLARLAAVEADLNALGVQRLAADLRRRTPPPSTWPDCYDFAWMNSAIDDLSLRDPDVRGFLGNVHREHVEEFKHLDEEALDLTVSRVRRAHAERAIQVMNEHPAQDALIRTEASKSRAHKPLRKLFDQAWEVMTAVCPCWMASPLSVSQLISSGAKFDYVIFDEASQVLPEDAIPAILRGHHLVVAGDNQQLPPTGFFVSSSEAEEDEEDSAADGFESLLDMMIPFAKSFHLNWHYRSRDESLIAFSNHHIYDDRLITFPGPGGSPAIQHVRVDYIPEADGQEDSCAEEVRRVIELVLAHAEQRPTRSLGVITMGIKHAMRLQGALDLALKDRADIAEFFDTERTERFFIKNLERVQGDERDSIIVSVGYGKNRAGDLPLRFGPILSASGRRRLNVAFTRARSSMVIVSSFSYLDINPVKVRAGSGLEFLRNFLQYAESGGRLIGMSEITDEPMNEFETDVYTALEARGMKLVPQVGCSRFRIDFAVCHPDQPGHFVLAIECDGATYHSSTTARDRDRLRQRMLENLGWRFHRIWSTDWFLRKHEEVERAWLAYQSALSQSMVAEPVSDSGAERTRDNDVREKARLGRPNYPITKRDNIQAYSQAELDRLCDWVMADGLLKTHDEIVAEMFDALPFSRRGSRIDEALRGAIVRREMRSRRV